MLGIKKKQCSVILIVPAQRLAVPTLQSDKCPIIIKTFQRIVKHRHLAISNDIKDPSAPQVWASHERGDMKEHERSVNTRWEAESSGTFRVYYLPVP